MTVLEFKVCVCGQQIYETTVASLPPEHPKHKQWIHRHTGTTYCEARHPDAVATPREKE